MYRKLLMAVLAGFLACAGSVAASDEIVSYDLSLAGYSIGMSYDEAAAVRPLFYSQSPEASSGHNSIVIASTDPVYMDDVELDVLITFINDAISKVIAKVSPSDMEDVTQLFQQELGRAEDKSRTVKNFQGEEVRQKIYSWTFPDANMFLIETSSQGRYATLALTAKKPLKNLSEDDI